MKPTLLLPLAIIFIFFSSNVNSNHLNEIDGELKIRCAKLCSVKNQMYFDKDNSKCVCFLKNPIDDVDKRMMHKEAKTLGLILDIVTPTITKRNVESATEINLKEAPAKEISMGSILQAPPLILLKKEISPERTAEIIKGFETVKIELNHLINQLKLGKMDKKTLQQETEVLRRKLRRIVADNDMLQAIEDIKEKHMQLKSRLQPIKRSVNIKNFEPLRRSIIFK